MDISLFALMALFVYGALLLAALATYHLVRAKSRLPLPPGPKGKLISGNAHQIPKEELWKGFANWSIQLGMSSTWDVLTSCVMHLLMNFRVPDCVISDIHPSDNHSEYVEGCFRPTGITLEIIFRPTDDVDVS